MREIPLLSGIEIRRAREADVPQVVMLLAQLALGKEVREGDPSDARYVEQFRLLEQTGGLLFVATWQSRVVGTAVLHVLHRLSLTATPIAILENVVVDLSARGRAVGEQLVAHCVSTAREAGCQRIELTSRTERDRAHRFWRKCGFLPTHQGFKMALK